MRTEKPIIDLATTKHLFVEHREIVRAVFHRAVQEALLMHKRAGNPIAISENEKVVWLAPEQIQTNHER
jgi:hypothetical protein